MRRGLNLPGYRAIVRWWPNLSLGMAAVFALSATPAFTQQAPPPGGTEDARVYSTSNIHYVLDPANPSLISRVEFSTSGDVPEALVISLLADRSFWYDCTPANGRSFWRCDTTIDVRATVRDATLLTIGSPLQPATATPAPTVATTQAPAIQPPLETAPNPSPAPLEPITVPPAPSVVPPGATSVPSSATQPAPGGSSVTAPQGTPGPTVEVLPLTPPPATPPAAGTQPPASGPSTQASATPARVVQVLPLTPAPPTSTPAPRLVQPAPGLPNAGSGRAAERPVSAWVLLSLALVLAGAGLAGLSHRRR